jgi:uncharacterized phage protein (TIGR01671 family)
MREIKFRAWETQCQCEDCKGIWSWERLQKIRYGNPKNNIFNDSDYILMQYTGLKDKNGKEIYEGDIVICNEKKRYEREYSKLESVVIFENGMFVIKPTPNGWLKTFLSLLHSTVEVIGNIYENPDLLKES